MGSKLQNNLYTQCLWNIYDSLVCFQHVFANTSLAIEPLKKSKTMIA